jgi:hypothetical protein
VTVGFRWSCQGAFDKAPAANIPRPPDRLLLVLVVVLVLGADVWSREGKVLGFRSVEMAPANNPIIQQFITPLLHHSVQPIEDEDEDEDELKQ